MAISPPLHRPTATHSNQKTFSSARYLELVLAVGTILTCLNVLQVFGGIVDRGWFTFYRCVLHFQFGVYGCAVLATLLFLLPRSRLPALIRILAFAAFWVWLIWIIL